MEAKNCLIIGAGSDLARALAHQLAEDNWHLQLIGRNADTLKTLVSEIKPVAASVEAVSLDMNQVERCLDWVQTNTVRPSVVIVVGALMPEPNQPMCDQDLETLLDTNVVSTLRLLNELAEFMKAGGQGGIIVGVSSLAGLRGRSSNYAYGASKAALTTFLSGMRARYLRDGIHVMTVLPGFIATKMIRSESTPKLLTDDPDRFAKRIIQGIQRRSDYVDGGVLWRLIALVISWLPEWLFKRLRF